MTKAELLALRAATYRIAVKNQAIANDKLLALAARTLATLSPQTHERYAVLTWLLGDKEYLTEGEVAALTSIFHIESREAIAASRALFADMLALTRVPA